VSGSYEILSELGRGGMGIVYRARAPWGAEVALKQLLPGGPPDELERFERERRLLASFGEREGFVALLDAGETAAGPYLVMPLLTGGTLRARLRRGPMKPDDAAALGRALATALGHAHERGVVHRDLKPENVLFDASGRPFVADLGLAKHFRRDLFDASRSRALTQAGELLGTVGYMAPEQAHEGTVAAPADVFALGAILRECLTGERAFGQRVEVFFVEMASGTKPRGQYPPETPSWLRAAIDRALSPDPAARFQDGRAFARALAEPAAPRRRWPLVLVPCVLLAAALGYAFRGGPAPPEATPGPKPPPALTPREDALRIVAAGERLFAGHDDEAAIRAFGVAIARDSGVAAAWARRGEVRLANDDPKGARVDLDRALELDPSSIAALSARALARPAVPGDPDARADADRAIELDPRCALSWARRGALRRGGGDFDGALADGERAVALDPDCVEALIARSDARRSKDDVPGALADLERAIELDPRSAVALGRRATYRAKAGDAPGALADLARSLELNPRRASAWSYRSELRMDLADLEGALADANRAIEIDPERGIAYGRRGLIRAKLGDMKGSDEDFDAFMRLDPTHPSVASIRKEIEKVRRR
jgi:tetratricopeptide (TPR) repeat protein